MIALLFYFLVLSAPKSLVFVVFLFYRVHMKPNGYNLFENMKRNKTILLVDNIGYDYSSLKNLCKQIDISDTDACGKKRGYGTLVRDYLIKVKVGY